MHRTLPLLGVLLAVLAFLPALAACGGDDCSTQRVCQSVNGQLTCVWVRVCDGQVQPDTQQRLTSASRVDLPASDRWDVGIAGGTLAAHLLGAEVLAEVGMEEATRWWLHRWPAAAVRAAIEGLDAAGLRYVRDAAEDEEGPCAVRAGALADALPPSPARLRTGDALFLHAPSGTLPGHRHLGLVVTYRHESGDGAIRVLAEGAATAVVLERPGTWTVRTVLLTQDLCEPGAADAIFLREDRVEVDGGVR